MTTTENRLTRLETRHEMSIKEIKTNVSEIKTDISEIKTSVAALPDLIRKVNEHHSELKIIKPTVDNNQNFINDLAKHGCPGQKVMPKDLEELEKDKKATRYKTIAAVASVVAIISGMAYIIAQIDHLIPK